ncbi:MAG: hypothetical protein KKF65_01025, partial [Nanoarchaeota archaeon]|nr:hypothetical protein [Nanoarchaeota archaeon]
GLHAEKDTVSEAFINAKIVNDVHWSSNVLYPAANEMFFDKNYDYAAKIYELAVVAEKNDRKLSEKQFKKMECGK